MAIGYRLSRRANVDLQMIWNYTAERDFDAAQKVVAAIETAAAQVAENEGLGHYIDGVNPRIKFYRVFSYLIAYQLGTDPLHIVRIIHGARDIPRMFEAE